jgi:hypothetical protein
MRPSDSLSDAVSSARSADAGADGFRRMLLLTPLIASLPLALKTGAAAQARSIHRKPRSHFPTRSSLSHGVVVRRAAVRWPRSMAI